MADDADPWQYLPAQPRMDCKSLPIHALGFKTVEDVVPLDAQIGVAHKKTVPDALHPAMFGQPEPTAAEVRAAGGNPANVPPMQSYVLLDAAKSCIFRTGWRQASGLPHRCLYQGDAADNYGDAAPWLVQLEDGNALARNLFTATDEPDNLWWSDPGIFIRSRGEFDDIRSHLRKFTRLQDEQGRWFYFRFWQGWHLHVLAGRQEKLPELSRLCARILGEGEAIAPHHRIEEAVLTRPARERPAERLVLTAGLRADIKLAFFYRKIMASAFDLHEQHPDQAKRYGARPQDMWPLLFDFADEVRAADLRDPQCRRMARTAYDLGRFGNL